jgi:hypothetical protein
MKINYLKLSLLLISVGFLAQSAGLIAGDVTAFRTALEAVRPPELPAEAARLVRREPSKTQVPATIAVVKASSDLNPSAVLSVVGAISRTTPKMAPVAAATAAAWEPRLAWAFARTAALAAPDEAAEVVYAVASAVPKEAQAVALAVVQAVPESAMQVISALGRAVPELQPYLAAAVQLTANREVSASTIISQANKMLAADRVPVEDRPDEFSMPTGTPEVGAPFVIPTSTPGVMVPDPTHQVPPGQPRNYSKPS